FCDDMNDKFSKAMVSGDYNTIASMYTDDAVSLQSYEPMWVGKDAITQGNKKDLTESGMKWSNLTGKTMQIFGTGDTKIEIGTFEATFTMPNSTTAMTDHGKYINVWQKQNDGTWKLRADTWNSDMNPYTSQAGAKPKDNNGN
ncbi:MAG: SgcJ/EcaC family oxidoreductase, partial [Ignavibacteriaceae bacterium]|nr:SgcJ/EcaC family oxidoreductase [Ignavibacteriaceae bacterium]